MTERGRYNKSIGFQAKAVLEIGESFVFLHQFVDQLVGIISQGLFFSNMYVQLEVNASIVELFPQESLYLGEVRLHEAVDKLIIGPYFHFTVVAQVDGHLFPAYA